MGNNLAHHGIKGMKWGRRRYQNQDGTWTPAGKRRRASMDIRRVKVGVDSASTMVRESKNIRGAVSNFKKKPKSEASQMSDEELRERVKRLNLEQQYDKLTENSNTDRGRDYVGQTLEIAGSALAITSSALAIGVAIKELKKK